MSYLLCLCPVPVPLLPVPALPLQVSNYLLVLLHNNGPSTRQIYFPWGKEEILRNINLLQWVFRCCCFCSLHLCSLPWASPSPCHTSGHNFPRWATNHKTSFVSCEVQADTWSMFSSRVSPICALGWLLTLPQNSMSLPSLLLPPGTRWLNLFPTEFQIGHKPKADKARVWTRRHRFAKVHHLMVIGCSSPVNGIATNLWNCGGRCRL